MDKKLYKAVGVMSGTSLDGVDAVVIETDGESEVRLLGAAYREYPVELRERVSAVARGDVPLSDVLRVERALSQEYVAAVKMLPLEGVEIVGVHGQTVRHIPGEGLTWQLGDASFVAEGLGLPVVMDFRRRDMAAGGQGAPLVPLFHRALLGNRHDCGVLNIGGVSNLTWFGRDGGIAASDCGPGVGLLDAWVEAKTGSRFDEGGMLAAKGKANREVVERALREVAFWQRPLPRSADRYDFDVVAEMLSGLSVEDGAATLCAVTAAGVAATMKVMGAQGPVYVVGGGARNPSLIAELRMAQVEALIGEEAGLRGATMEAECFAWLAVRRLRSLVFSEPATTGCRHGTVGGLLTV